MFYIFYLKVKCNKGSHLLMSTFMAYFIHLSMYDNTSEQTLFLISIILRNTVLHTEIIIKLLVLCCSRLFKIWVHILIKTIINVLIKMKINLLIKIYTKYNKINNSK